MPRSGQNEISALFYTGPDIDFSKAPELEDQDAAFVFSLFELGHLRLIQNGPVKAIVSLQGLGHVDLARVLPPGAKILGGTRFERENGKIQNLRNSLYFGQQDGMAVHQKYFNFEIQTEQK